MQLYTHGFLTLLISLYSTPIFSACQIKPQKITEVSEQRAPNNFVPIILLQF